MRKAQLKKYAKLIAKVGLNVKKGQSVFIAAGLDQPEFVTMVVEECYKAGASEVFVEWSHQPVEKLSSNYRTLESLSEMKSWALAKWEYKAEKYACRLFIESEDPDGMSGVDQEKMSKARRALYPLIKPLREKMENKRENIVNNLCYNIFDGIESEISLDGLEVKFPKQAFYRDVEIEDYFNL